MARMPWIVATKNSRTHPHRSPLQARRRLEQFDRRDEELTPEEREYAERLIVLIEAFEDASYALEGSTADGRLRSLMEEHRLRQRSLLDVFRLPGRSFGGC